MNVTVALLLTFLVVCAVHVSLTKDLLASVLILMGYSTVMSVIWLVLESPDLAITEAAVGAGVTSILFFVTFRRIGLIGSKEVPGDSGKVTGKDSGRDFSKATASVTGNEASKGITNEASKKAPRDSAKKTGKDGK